MVPYSLASSRIMAHLNYRLTLLVVLPDLISFHEHIFIEPDELRHHPVVKYFKIVSGFMCLVPEFQEYLTLLSGQFSKLNHIPSVDTW